MTDRLEAAVARAVAEAEFYVLSSSAEASLADIMEAALDEAERDYAAVKRIEAAGAELARINNLYPERATTREMLDSAGVTVQALGLENGDQELIDLWRAEDDSRP
jgi:multidrug resistance efflux pump